MLLRSVARLAVAVLCLTSAGAQTRLLTVEQIFGYDGWERFNGSRAATLAWAPEGDPWLSDTQHLWPGESHATEVPGGSPWMRVDAVSGESRPLFTYSQLDRALVAAGAPAADARSAARRAPSVFSRERDAVLLTLGDDLYAYKISTDTAIRLTDSAGAKSEATFSPDGAKVAFIKNHNIFIASTGKTGERALTSDGAADLLNGTLDWVYSEELYGRGNHRAYWWSPDSSHIAFLQLDEKAVPDYVLIDDIPYAPALTRWKYPKAGDPNPVVRLGVVSAATGSLRWVDTSHYTDFLVVSVAWAPNSLDVVYQLQDRTQTWLDLNRADVRTGTSRNILRETSTAWVERWQDPSVDPIWLKDGSFLWLSERSGWRHFYHYTPNGTLVRQVTHGAWEVRRAHGVDPGGSWIYFSSTTHSAIGLDLYRIRLTGADLQRVTSADGRHQVFVNPSRTLFLDSWSDATTPPQVRLHDTGASGVVRVVDANPVRALN